MNFEEFKQRIRLVHPNAASATIISATNQALLEEPIFANKNQFATIDIVDDTRWYDLPDAVQELEQVWYKNADGEWEIIKELIGVIDTEDIT